MRPHLSARGRIALALAAALTGSAALAVNAYATPDASDGKKAAAPAAAAPSGLNGPYLYLGWGNPPNAADLMKETGLTQLTMAFILSDGGCSPAWDGSRPLEGGQDAQTIKAVQDAGGDITPSIGGWSGSKLGEVCSNAQDLAGAYQKVIDAYGLKSIDVDIESTEVENPEVRQRVIDALKIVKEKNSGIKVYLTFGTTPQGPNANGKDLIQKGADAGLDVDGWTVMPFDFGDGTTDLAAATKSAVDGLAKTVGEAYGISTDEAYGKVGFSSMNGKTDVEGESVSPSDFQEMVDYAKERGLARASFWSVNRDRPCDGGGADSCSGVDQQPWEFSKILAGYTG
ncbi:chitinase [Streptomyces abyssalis]|uniref:Chitinase n=1 Tax=Streptomyces abyssalis TaxID=933944 RepID=A0A1E7JGY9_9ACTN|nr:chitinase [Streptomyces abyssalis]OEU85754.1 chitinase [Streptomyces abyssalis]OEU92781.1 chitinase [Streptomyces abyssalis]OEV04820.1 chitinase [Streptomyces nanshensis]